jgi:hypothetical protein
MKLCWHERSQFALHIRFFEGKALAVQFIPTVLLGLPGQRRTIQHPITAQASHHAAAFPMASAQKSGVHPPAATNCHAASPPGPGSNGSAWHSMANEETEPCTRIASTRLIRRSRRRMNPWSQTAYRNSICLLPKRRVKSPPTGVRCGQVLIGRCLSSHDFKFLPRCGFPPEDYRMIFRGGTFFSGKTLGK